MLEGKVIDKNIPVPMYYQLKNIILDEIMQGTIKSDEMIPTEKELSEMFQLSRTTVRQAILELTQEGYLYRVKSKGTFVSRPKDNQGFIIRLESYAEHMKRLGKVPRTEVLSCKIVKIPSVAIPILKIPANSDVIELSRLRFADEEPIVHTLTYLPYDSCRRLLDDNLNLEMLYASLATSKETKICKLQQSIEAVGANAKDTELLKIRRGFPIQLLKIVGFNKDDVPLEFTCARFRGDRNKFECAILVDEE